MQELEQWQIDAIAECTASDEHLKRVIPSNGYDVCFNCGGTL